jgi:hypothetical protein
MCEVILSLQNSGTDFVRLLQITDDIVPINFRT